MKNKGFPHILVRRSTPENDTWILQSWEPWGVSSHSLHLRHLWQISQASLPDLIPLPWKMHGMETQEKSACEFFTGVVPMENTTKQNILSPWSDFSVLESLSPGKPCLLVGKDTWPHSDPQWIQQLRQLPYGWGISLFSQCCSAVLLGTVELMPWAAHIHKVRASSLLFLHVLIKVQEGLQKTKKENSKILYLRLNVPKFILWLPGVHWVVLLSVYVASQGICLAIA